MLREGKEKWTRVVTDGYPIDGKNQTLGRRHKRDGWSRMKTRCQGQDEMEILEEAFVGRQNRLPITSWKTN